MFHGLQKPIVVTGTTGEPLTLAEAKEHLRIVSTSTGDDTDITRMIRVATRQVEHLSGLQLMPATFRLRLDAFPTDVLDVPLPPLRGITSIGYVDPDGTTQQMSSTNYEVDTDSMPGRVRPIYGQVWPSIRAQMNAVTIVYTNGYAASTDVPDAARHAIRFLVSQFYEMREPVNVGNIVNEVPMTVKHLVESFAVPRYA